MHHPWWGRWGIALALAIALQACGPTKPRAPAIVSDEDRLDWAAEEPWFIVVRTSCRTLDVYRNGDRVRSYPAVFGIGGIKNKLHEGDHKTPTGLYAIVGERWHPRWRRFLLLDYPNVRDVHRYEVAFDEGYIPMLGNQPAGIGGAVGIHGSDHPGLNARKVDWTWGCISISNDDVEDLATLVPVGTLVLIEE
jgi:murein L,D-transpeptidase YafK